MARTTAVRLTGEDLTLADVWEVVGHEGVELDESAREKMAAARAVVEEALASDEPTYGVTTGFGRFVSTRVPSELAEELQLRLLRSHACGVGEPYPEEIVRAAMLMRANALAKGYSGARVDVAELLLECLGRDVIPEVPSRGSVGASGDLAPLAHLALPLVGEDERAFRASCSPGRMRSPGPGGAAAAAGEGRTVTRERHAVHGRVRGARGRAGDKAREGRGLRLRSVSRRIAGVARGFLPSIHELRALPGQAASASNILRLLTDSAIVEAHRWCDRVQDAYSLRCAAQVHGASGTLACVEHTAAAELNAATDNPLVFADEGTMLTNGNFTASRSRSPSTPSPWRSASWRASPSGERSGS